MRHTYIFLIISLMISGALAAGYFVLGYGKDYVSNAPATGLQTGVDTLAIAFNPQNEMGMIFILGVMVVLAAIAILKSQTNGEENSLKSDSRSKAK